MKARNKTQIIILTHGNWGEELIESVELIIGKIEAVKAFPLMAEESIESYVNNINTFINSIKEETPLILTDTFGGTPFQVACTLVAAHDNVYSINGLSMDMLLAADKLRKQYSGKELVYEIIKSSYKSIVDIKELFRSIDS